MEDGVSLEGEDEAGEEAETSLSAPDLQPLPPKKRKLPKEDLVDKAILEHLASAKEEDEETLFGNVS